MFPLHKKQTTRRQYCKETIPLEERRTLGKRDIDNPLNPPPQEFPKLLESVSSRLPGGVVLVLDGADRFKDAESQLAWLLDPLPVDVRVFVAAEEDACPKSWKSWPTLTVESLANNGVRELLVAAFKAAGRNLLDADSLNLIQVCARVWNFVVFLSRR